MNLLVPPREPAWPAPPFLGRPRAWLALLVLLLVPFLVPVPMVLRRDLLIATLGDRLHVVLLAALTLLLYWRGPLAGHLARSAIAAVLVGGAVEFLQLLVGRAALWHDFQLDLVGVALAVGLVLWRGHGRRAGLLLVLATVALTAWELRNLPARKLAVDELHDRFPVLSDFAGPRPLTLWMEHEDAEVDLATGPRGTVARLIAAPPAAWPGLILAYFPHDWSAYDALKLEVRLARAAADSVRFGVRLDDYRGRRDGDWLSRAYTVTGEWRTCTVPFVGQPTFWSERPFEPDDVFALSVFIVHPADSVVIEIADVRLE
jgi:hypothetical protein